MKNIQQSLPDLKFQYEEEQDSREFFVPYVWALVHRRTFIYWSDEKAHILEEYRQVSGEADTHHPEDSPTATMTTSSSFQSEPQ